MNASKKEKEAFLAKYAYAMNWPALHDQPK
jgi:hypothetical protein